jgi:hypothetical protein
MTFDDYIIKLDRTDHDWWVDIKWQIDAWNEGGKDFPEGTRGPCFNSLEDLIKSRNLGHLWESDFFLQFVWEVYCAVDEMTAAGIDFDAAEEAASTLWCHGRCGRDWGDVGGPMIANKDWRRIVKPGERILCSACIEQRLGGPDAVRQSSAAYQKVFDRWLERRSRSASNSILPTADATVSRVTPEPADGAL